MIAPNRRRDRDADTAWIWIALLALALALGARAAEMWGVRFSTGDEMWGAWIKITGQLSTATFDIARDTGRVYLFLYIPVGSFVTSLKSDLAYNLLNVGTFVFGPIVLALSFRRYVGLAPVLLALLLHATLFAHSVYMPPLAYPVIKYYPLLVLGCAIFALQSWLDHGGVLRLLLFGLLFALSLYQYESITIVAVLFTGFALLAERAAGTTPRGDSRWRIALVVVVLLIVVYGAAYLGFRALFPSVYPGTTVAPWAPRKIAQVLTVFGFGGAAPYNLFAPLQLTVIDRDVGPSIWNLPLPLSSLLRDLRFVDLAVAGGAFLGIIACLWRPVRGNVAMFWLALLTALLLFLGANFLQALTTQYQFLVDFRQGWIGSRYSLLALAMAVAGILVAVRSLLGPLPALVLVFSAGGALAAGALLAGTDNRIAVDFLRMRSARFDALKFAHACPEIAARINGRAIFAPRLIDPIAGVEDWAPDFWRSWIRYRYGTEIRLIDDRDAAERIDARLDWQTDATGRLSFVVFADGNEEAAPALVALAPAAHGFLSWRDQDWHAETRSIDPGSQEGACGGGLRLVTLPGAVRPDTITLAALPSLDRLAPPADARARIEFGLDAANDPRREGWSGREPTGTWTTAQVATAVIQLPHAPTGGLVLDLQGTGYDISRKPVGIAVRLDGVELGRATLSVWSPLRYVFRIPDDIAQRGGEATIEIVADELRKPSDNGSTDQRTLGVFVRSITVRPMRSADSALFAR